MALRWKSDGSGYTWTPDASTAMPASARAQAGAFYAVFSIFSAFEAAAAHAFVIRVENTLPAGRTIQQIVTSIRQYVRVIAEVTQTIIARITQQAAHKAGIVVMVNNEGGIATFTDSANAALFLVERPPDVSSVRWQCSPTETVFGKCIAPIRSGVRGLHTFRAVRIGWMLEPFRGKRYAAVGALAQVIARHGLLLLVARPWIVGTARGPRCPLFASVHDADTRRHFYSNIPCRLSGCGKEGAL